MEAYQECLTALVLASAVASIGAWALWERSRCITFPLGIGAIYFWTIHGGWAITSAVYHGAWHTDWSYLMDKMFPVLLTTDYLQALLTYTVFMAAIIVATWCSLPPKPQSQSCASAAELYIDHNVLLRIAMVSALVSLFLASDVLLESYRTGVSGYILVSKGMGGSMRHTMTELFIRGTLVASVIGFVSLIGGDGRKLVWSSRTRHTASLYFVLLTVLALLCSALGNKNALLVAFLAAISLYSSNVSSPRYALLAFSGVSVISLIASINFIRQKGLGEAFQSITTSDPTHLVSAAFQSHEQFAAHLSMYGAIAYDLPLTYGASLISLCASAIPRALWPDRPETSYDYYAQGVGLPDDQGFTIHHATGWYLNFGLPGVLIGGMIIGVLWGRLYGLAHSSSGHRRLPSLAIRVLLFFLFTAGIPRLMRSGPEGYKSLLITNIAVPFLLVIPACRVLRVRAAGNPQFLSGGRNRLQRSRSYDSDDRIDAVTQSKDTVVEVS